MQHILEEHYAFVLAYTHLVRDEGLQHTRARFDSVPAIVRPLVAGTVRGSVKKLLWQQGILRHSHEEIIASAVRDWRAVLTVMGDYCSSSATSLSMGREVDMDFWLEHEVR